MYSVYQHWDKLKTCVVGKSYPPEFYSFIQNPKLRTLFEKIAAETEEDFIKLEKAIKDLIKLSEKLTFILYLNDIEEGGETEFLYYSKRIKAEKGKLIMWPAGFTHTHRGNPPLTDVKYILTGWLEFD